MSIVLNEYTWAENALNSRELGRRPTETLCRVAKYLLYNHMDKNDVRKNLERFLVECDPTANLVKWSNTIDRVIKFADKYPIIMIDSISVSSSELQRIASLEGKQLQRLAFTLLCLSKYYYALSEKNDHWVSTPDTEIMKMANIRTSIKRQGVMYGQLRDLGLIRFSKKIDNLSVQVLFADDNDCELSITDFRNLGYQYLKYRGEPYYTCECCGITTKLNNALYSSRTKYCSDCAIKIRMQQNINSVMRGRNMPKHKMLEV